MVCGAIGSALFSAGRSHFLEKRGVLYVVAMTTLSSRLLGILGAAAILSCVAAFSSGSSGCNESGIGNLYCERENNNAECGMFTSGC